MNHTLLKIATGASLRNVPTDTDPAFSQQNAPDSTVAHVQPSLHRSAGVHFDRRLRAPNIRVQPEPICTRVHFIEEWPS